jgi:predicted small lipoprotein YifL
MGQTTQRIRPVLVIPALVALVTAAACGQKGPLYLPGNPGEMQTIQPAADEPTPDEEDEDGDNDTGADD